VHHMVLGLVLVLTSGMVNIALSVNDTGREILAVIFGVGGAFILDEFALSFHLRDVYWTEEGRRSIDASIMWLLLGLLLLVGISPFGIHDQTVVPRTIGFVVVAINIVLSIVTCLKGKLTVGLLSVFIPPVGLVTAIRLARPGSIWAQLFYPPAGAKLERAQKRFHPHESRIEHVRIRVLDLLAGAPNASATPK
jgi:lysyl-tRNA synthetase, class II